MSIPTTITCRNVRCTPALEASIRNWAAKLDAFHPHVDHCHVTIEASRRSRRSPRQVRVSLQIGVPGGPVVAHHTSDRTDRRANLFTCARDTFDTARRQLDEHARRRSPSEHRQFA